MPSRRVFVRYQPGETLPSVGESITIEVLTSSRARVVEVVEVRALTTGEQLVELLVEREIRALSGGEQV